MSSVNLPVAPSALPFMSPVTIQSVEEVYITKN